jgi:hypothetical protein
MLKQECDKNYVSSDHDPMGNSAGLGGPVPVYPNCSSLFLLNLLESNNCRGFEYRVGEEKSVIWEREDQKKIA